MSYEKYYPGGWQSGESGGTPITPEALNHIENGVKELDQGKAPAGYGLGEYATNISYKSLESVFKSGKSGLYRGQVITELTELGNQWVWLDIRIESATYGLAYGCTYGGNKFIVRFARGVVQPLDWENPPMALGVEYRTTEQCNGYTVYAKRIRYTLSSAISADNSTVDTKIPHGISNFSELVRCNCWKQGYVLPYLKDNGGFTAISRVESTDITLRVHNASWSPSIWDIDLYYVKS